MAPFKLHLLVFFFFITSSAKGQYEDDKTRYDYKSYNYLPSDKYHPAIAGVASFVVPGLGQIYCNEPERGFKFMSGYGGALLVGITGGTIQVLNDFRGERNNTGYIILFTGVIAASGIQIWSVVDAVRVAKVNNLSLREKTSHSINLIPNFIQDPIDKSLKTGFTMRISF